MDPEQLTKIVVAWEGQLKRDQDARAQARDAKGQPLFDLSGKPTASPKATRFADRDGAPLYLSPPNGMLIQTHQKPSDRTNGGKGWTSGELDASWYMDSLHNQFRHSGGRAAYLATEANRLTLQVDLKPFMEPLRHPVAHVVDCTQALNAVRADVVEYRRKLTAHISSLNADILAHLWVMPEFSGPALQSLQATAKTVDTLARRVDALVAGFGQLPQAAPTPTSLPR
jgi:MoxR-like ATPase